MKWSWECRNNFLGMAHMSGVTGQTPFKKTFAENLDAGYAVSEICRLAIHN